MSAGSAAEGANPAISNPLTNATFLPGSGGESPVDTVIVPPKGRMAPMAKPISTVLPSVEISQKPEYETVLVRESFGQSGDLLRSEVIASLGITYSSSSKLRLREQIALQAAAAQSDELAEGRTVQARTRRTGAPVATITPVRNIPSFRARPDSELVARSMPKEIARGPKQEMGRQESDFHAIERSVEGVAIAVVGQALVNGLKDLFIESPEARAVRERKEAEEARALQDAQARARSELNTAASKLQGRASATLASLSAAASSSNRETVEHATQMADAIEQKVQPVESVSIRLSRAEEEALRERYGEQGALGKVMFQLLESFKADASESDRVFARSVEKSSPALFAQVISDIIELSERTAPEDVRYSLAKEKTRGQNSGESLFNSLIDDARAAVAWEDQGITLAA